MPNKIEYYKSDAKFCSHLKFKSKDICKFLPDRIEIFSYNSIFVLFVSILDIFLYEGNDKRPELYENTIMERINETI